MGHEGFRMVFNSSSPVTDIDSCVFKLRPDSTYTPDSSNCQSLTAENMSPKTAIILLLTIGMIAISFLVIRALVTWIPAFRNGIAWSVSGAVHEFFFAVIAIMVLSVGILEISVYKLHSSRPAPTTPDEKAKWEYNMAELSGKLSFYETFSWMIILWSA